MERPSILAMVCCVTLSLGGLSLSVLRLLREAAAPYSAVMVSNAPTGNQAETSHGVDDTAQTDALERQFQEAGERARAARVAYAILRNRGNAENSPACECQVRRSELADREQRRISRLIASVTAGRHGPDDGATVAQMSPDSSDNPVPTRQTIPDRLWQGGNDRFMGFRPQPQLDAK